MKKSGIQGVGPLAPRDPSQAVDTKEQSFVSEKASPDEHMLSETSSGSDWEPEITRLDARAIEQMYSYKRCEGVCYSSKLLECLQKGQFYRNLDHLKGQFDPRCACQGCSVEKGWKKLQDRYEASLAKNGPTIKDQMQPNVVQDVVQGVVQSPTVNQKRNWRRRRKRKEMNQKQSQ